METEFSLCSRKTNSKYLLEGNKKTFWPFDGNAPLKYTQLEEKNSALLPDILPKTCVLTSVFPRQTQQDYSELGHDRIAAYCVLIHISFGAVTAFG